MSSQESYESLIESALASTVSKLNSYSVDELKEILNNDERIDSLIADLPQAKTVQTEKEMLLAQNKSLAEWNLSQEPKIREAKERLLNVHQEASAVKTEVDTLRSQLDELASKRSLDTTLALLQAAAREAEDESESLAECILNGEIGSDEFVTKFQELRRTAHERKVKSEKLAEILRSQQYHPSRQAAPAPPPRQYPPGGGYVGYPTTM